jgi:hypothetical protein
MLLLALGATGGALMSTLQPQIRQYATERVFAARAVHSLSGSRAYDADVVAEIVFTVEAGLSFFHTHGEGMGLILLFASTLVASLALPPKLRAGLHWLLGFSALFPVGYLAYSALILLYGRDRGIALAERVLLIPSGSSAILALAGLAGAAGLLLVNGRLRRGGARPLPIPAATRVAPPERHGWRRPPRIVVLTAALLIALAELGGAAMGRFKPEIDTFTSARVRERPEQHGLVGSLDVDAEILEEIRVKADAGLRLFHLHGEGVGLMIFAGALVVATCVSASWLRRALYAGLTVGGFLFPFGYVIWSALTPFHGVEAARRIAALSVLVPSGTLFLLALWALLFPLGRALLGRRRATVEEMPAGPVPEPTLSMRRPVMVLVVAALVLLVLAEGAGGVMTQAKVDLDRWRRAQVEARPVVHGLSGVRPIDGPVIDTVLSRADFALRLFHLHGEGVALVMVAGGIIASNFISSRLVAGVVQTLLAVGGFLYPFGYLAWSLMMPVLGLQPARELAEVFVWAPFGGAVVAAMSLTVLVLAGELLLRGDASPGDP